MFLYAQVCTDEELLASAAGDASELRETVATAESAVQFCVSTVKQRVTTLLCCRREQPLRAIYLY